MWKRSNKPSRTNSRRRGSVLVIVVAVLTLIALIGTAYIATARLDRYNTRNSVVNAEKEATRDDYIAQAEKLVKEVIAHDIDNPVTGPRTCAWLADRLPQPVNPDIPYHITGNPAIWRFITGKLHPDLEDDRYYPPMWPPVNAPASGNGVPEVAVLLKEGNPGTWDGANRYGARPSWITLSYPNNYPVEAYRNKVRTYPAFQFLKPTNNVFVPNNNNPYIYLAADADGDGIADSVLYRISSGPVQGVTYYAGIRIIDNSSAININTARTRGDADYNPTTGNPVDPTGQSLRTFFPSSIGLRELFMSLNFTPTPNPGYELWAIDDYRFGFENEWTEGTNNNWDKWIPWPIPLADKRIGPAPLGVQVYSRSGDYAYTTLGEALSMQLARRLEHPGLNQVNGYAPPDRVAQDTRVFRFRAFDDASTTALAYRFCMLRIDPETDDVRDSLTTLEQRIFEAHKGAPLNARIDSLVRSAPNYTDDPHNTFRSLPPDEVDWWFRHLNYDDKRSLSNPMGALANVAVKGDSPVPNRFRSVRPLLTGHNPVTNLIQVKNNGLAGKKGTWGGLNFAQGYLVADVLYPGMLCLSQPDKAFPLSRYRGNYKASVTYYVGDIVTRVFKKDTKDEYTLSYMYIGPDGTPTSMTPEADSWWAPRFWDPQPFVCGLAKASVNTAGFPELWRAYYLAMSDPDDVKLCPYEKTESTSDLNASRDNYRGMGFSGSAPSTGTTQKNVLRMFRSSLRDDRSLSAGRLILDPNQMMVLRSALAAVNTITLRNKPPAGVVPERDFTLYRFATAGSNTTALRDYEVSVFGMVPQPFITEVYANNDTNHYKSYHNPAGYVAIELYNPYNTAINLKDWRLAILKRNSGTLSLVDSTAEHTFGAADSIPAGGYLILESRDASSPGNTYRPPSSKLSLTGTLTGAVSVKILAQSTAVKALENEVVLLRPKDAAHPPTSTPAFPDMVPVDQFDFSGLSPATNVNKTWHYVRSTSNWEFVYPGRYDGTHSGARHQGVDVSSYKGSLYNENATDEENKKAMDPWNPSGTESPFLERSGNPSVTLGNSNTSSSYDRTCVIPWHTTLAAPPKPSTVSSTVNVYPFGGFARNADILQVPFIGAYTIRDLAGKVVEMNAVTMDSAFAEDSQPDNNMPNGSTPATLAEIKSGIREQVGRFCPLMPIPSTSPMIVNDWYDWTGRIFEYLDVQSPAEDFFPNADPATYTGTSPVPVGSSGQLYSEMYEGRDETVPVHGKININTAPTKVLAMLPLVPNTAGLIDVTQTEQLARNIDTFRRGYPNWRSTNLPPNYGPIYRDAFDTILDLNRVPEVRTQAGLIANTSSNSLPNAQKAGNYLVDPYTPTDADHLKIGYDDRFLITNRVSNLITTRSDTFTVYIVLQGWREADTDLPCLEWEQRKAFIIDRSAGPDKLKITPVPTD